MLSKSFFLALFIFIIIQRILETFSKRDKEKGEIRQKWTLSLLLIVYFIVVFGSIPEYLLFKREINLFVTIIGLILYLFALIVRNWCIVSLGKYWSIQLEIRKDHRLVKKGPYMYIRHPTYLSLILEVCGIPLIVNAYIIFLFAVIFYIPIVMLRIYYEEKEHLKLFGKKYLKYKNETGVFIPIKKPREHDSTIK